MLILEKRAGGIKQKVVSALPTCYSSQILSVDRLYLLFAVDAIPASQTPVPLPAVRTLSPFLARTFWRRLALQGSFPAPLKKSFINPVEESADQQSRHRTRRYCPQKETAGKFPPDESNSPQSNEQGRQEAEHHTNNGGQIRFGQIAVAFSFMNADENPAHGSDQRACQDPSPHEIHQSGNPATGC